jgi:PAS domain S-box-containing protein
MTAQNDRRSDFADRLVDSTTLCQRAEEEAKAAGDQDLEALSPEDARRRLHELRVHQIELEERVRELDCLHGISALIEQPGMSLEEILQGAVRLLPPAWRFPEATCARILFEDREFRTENYRETEWRQAADLVVHGRPAGRVEVYHSEPRSQGDERPFLAQQQNLVVVVAQRLAWAIDRTQSEEALRTQRQQLELIIDSVPAYIAYADADLNLLHTNRALAEWWGYAKEQVVGKNYEDVTHPGTYEFTAPHLRQAVASRQSVTIEFKSVSATGQIRDARATYVPHPGERGNVQGIVVLTLDVTEQRRAEEALRASEERYRLLVENMREGLAVVDENARLTYVNDSLCAMTGWARDELLDQPSVKLFAAEDQEQHLSWIARRRAGFSDVYEAVFRRRDGGGVPVLISASPIQDPQGHFRGSLAVCTDITRRVEAEEALRRRVEELTVLNRIAHTMAAAAELPATLAQATEIIAGLFAAPCVHILWREGEEAGFGLHVGCEPGSEQAGSTRLDAPLNELPVLGGVLRESKSRVVADVGSLPLSGPERKLLAHRSLQAVMFIPLMIGGTAVGLLCIASDQPGRLFTANDMRLGETIALDLAAAIESARLARQAQAAAVAEERSRLARELHDSITQTLYSVSILAEALPRVLERDLEDAKRNARYMRQVVLGALAEMRTLLFELRPEALEAADLGVLLGQLAASLRGRGRLGVDLKVEGKVEPPPDIKIGLYRIAQEAFNNIARHARATHVTAVLQDLPDRVLLTIQDDGRGFDPDSVPAEQMGLRIMRERAEAIGLQLVIESHAGRGTKVAVTWQKDEGRRPGDK